MENQKQQEVNNFTQLCVWPGALLTENVDASKISSDEISVFENYMLKEFGSRIKFDSVQITNPDKDDVGNVVPETGGRSDAFFYIHREDIRKFALPRLNAGIRWWEDVISYNDNSNHLYSEEFVNSKTVTW